MDSRVGAAVEAQAWERWRRNLFRLANKESMRNREDEGLLGLGCATQKWTPTQFISKADWLRAYVYARLGALLWGGLVSCGRLAMGQLPRLHRAAAVANRRAGCQSAPHQAAIPLLCRAPLGLIVGHSDHAASPLEDMPRLEIPA